MDQIAVLRKKLSKFEFDALFGAREDREDSNSKHFGVDVFEKSGVAHAANNVLVDFFSLVAFEDFALHAFAVNIHSEVVNDGAFGDGEYVDSFELVVMPVVEDLFKFDVGDVFFNVNVDVLSDESEGREALFGWDENAERKGG